MFNDFGQFKGQKADATVAAGRMTRDWAITEGVRD